VRDSWKDIAPEVSASFDPQYVAPAGLFAPSRSWRFTLLLTQPLFQSGLQRAVTAERETQLASSRIALTDLQIQARSEVRLARESINSRERTLASARQAVEQAEEVRVITTTAFEAGATTNLEVIDAQRSARDAEVRAALAEDALQQARLDLLVAIGQFPR
jgi:outer membrane protein TolC